MSEIIDMGVELGIIENSGAWFYYDGNRLGQGKDNARAAIESDPSLAAELEEKIKLKRSQMDEGDAPVSVDDLDDIDDLDELGDDLDIRLIDLGD